MNRIGLNTFLFLSPFTNQSTKWFKKFKAMGFDTVELPVEDPAHIDPAHVKRELDKAGLACGSICACTGADRDLRGTPRQQKIAMTYFKTLIDQMVILECPSLIGPVYSATGRADAVPREEYRQQWKLVKSHLKNLAVYAGERGKQVCLEPLNRFETDFINTCEQGLQMVKEVNHPAMKLQLDTFHMNIEEPDMRESIRLAGPRLFHFHVADSNRWYPGAGHIDFPALVAVLREIGYAGYVSVEAMPMPDADTCAEKSVAAMRLWGL